jgi:GTP cyclohydrolase IA
MTRRVTWAEVYERLGAAPEGRLYGIPRGGAIVAGLTGRAVDRVEDADWVVEDVIDSGSRARALAQGRPIWGLFDRSGDGAADSELIFPWEDSGSQRGLRHARLERLGRELLETLGYDPSTPQLRDTPRRWASWWEEFVDFDPGRTDTTFETATSDQMVVVSGLRVWSVCEHHLLPFVVDAAVGYLPQGDVLGLSKFARLASSLSHRLQLQERLTSELAQAVADAAGSEHVAVLTRGRHLCIEARGVRAPLRATSIVTRGRFGTEADLRSEFLSLAGQEPAPSPEADDL